MAGETYGIALVPSTRQAMEGEALAKAAGLAVRIIPTPGSSTHRAVFPCAMNWLMKRP